MMWAMRVVSTRVLPVPAPAAGDGDKGIFGDGPVRIRLDADGNPLR